MQQDKVMTTLCPKTRVSSGYGQKSQDSSLSVCLSVINKYCVNSLLENIYSIIKSLYSQQDFSWVGTQRKRIQSIQHNMIISHWLSNADIYQSEKWELPSKTFPSLTARYRLTLNLLWIHLLLAATYISSKTAWEGCAYFQKSFVFMKAHAKHLFKIAGWPPASKQQIVRQL